MDYRSIIESKYNRANWQGLLYDIFRQRVQFWQQPQLVPVDESMAKRALYTGKITLPDGHIIAIYEVELSDSVVIERNRAGIRNLLCTNWRGMGCSGAFMFCFRQNEAVLRFSYVSESFVFAEDGSLTKESTDTKRFTYLLGEGHRSRTAIKQFEDLKKSALDLKAITKAFSVEALSDLFFKEYKKQYEDIIEFITGKRMVKVANKWEEQVTGQPCREIMQEFSQFPDAEKAVRDYVKKLMGRLVFIQFLQKKGWMGCSAGEAWNDGDKEFVQNLFANTSHKNTFVDDVLEPLFNDINTKRNGDIASSQNVGNSIKIPYLNGGLFEKDDYDKTNFPLPAKYMKNLLDFFASYNFTIDENDPDDAEIGVDPEMLGRIFENLLEDNKDKGAFYTPKEIVQYMCRESLIAYLQTDVNDDQIKDSIRQFVTTYDASVLSEELKETVDQKLKDVKICDPAIGSGAFPMGLLRELYACRKAIEGIDDETAVSIKTHIIQNNIYGVDIEKGAVDIARLRFWLALIVDEKNPHALPNMDFKIMQGNSLLEQYEGVELSGMSLNEQRKRKAKKGQVWQQTFAFDEQYALDNIQNAIKEYYLTDDHASKLNLRGIVNENVRSYILNLKGCTSDIQRKIEKLPIPNDQFFLWHIYFKEVFDNGGFDIVIGNPPYGANIDNLVDLYKRLYKDAIKSYADIYKIFIAFGFDILCYNGVLCYITPNTYISQPRYKDLRSVLTKLHIIEISNLGENVFDAVVPTAIFIARNNTVFSDYFYKDYSNDSNFMGLLHSSNQRVINAKNVELDKNLNLAITDEISNSLTLEDVFELKDAGIQYHRVNIGLKNKGGNDLYERLFSEDPTNFDTVEPVWYGKLVSKYYVFEVTDEFFNKSYKAILRENEKVSFNLPSFNQKEKIIWRQTADRLIATIDYNQRWFRNTIQCAYLKEEWKSKIDIKFALGVFNSSYIRYKYNEIVREAGRVFPQVKLTYLRQLPFCQCEKEKQEPIIRYVTEIMEIKSKNPLADTSVLESKIDQLIYELYGLSSDEVKLIEDSFQ